VIRASTPSPYTPLFRSRPDDRRVPGAAQAQPDCRHAGSRGPGRCRARAPDRDSPGGERTAGAAAMIAAHTPRTVSAALLVAALVDRKSTRLNSSHVAST